MSSEGTACFRPQSTKYKHWIYISSYVNASRQSAEGMSCHISEWEQTNLWFKKQQWQHEARAFLMPWIENWSKVNKEYLRHLIWNDDHCHLCYTPKDLQMIPYNAKRTQQGMWRLSMRRPNHSGFQLGEEKRSWVHLPWGGVMKRSVARRGNYESINQLPSLPLNSDSWGQTRSDMGIWNWFSWQQPVWVDGANFLLHHHSNVNQLLSAANSHWGTNIHIFVFSCG